MRDRMGGYWHPKPADGSHYANLLGLPVCAYDMYKRGAGFPDWIVFVSYFCVTIEVKNLEGRGMRFTPDEERFQKHFRGVYKVFTTEEEVYEFLLFVAKEVLYIEEEMAAKFPKEYARVFFPRIDDFATSKTKEEWQADRKTVTRYGRRSSRTGKARSRSKGMDQL